MKACLSTSLIRLEIAANRNDSNLNPKPEAFLRHFDSDDRAGELVAFAVNQFEENLIASIFNAISEAYFGNESLESSKEFFVVRKSASLRASFRESLYTQCITLYGIELAS